MERAFFKLQFSVNSRHLNTPMTLFEQTIPLYKRMLANLDAILVKAGAWAAEKKMSDETILKARLVLDMFPLVKQVQVACDNAKNTAFRLSGKEVIKFEDKETSLEELRGRIHKTLELLNEFTEADFADATERKIVMPYHDNKVMPGEVYVLEYALPNFFFHLTTAYDILRHYGLDIGKKDYLGPLSLQDPQ